MRISTERITLDLLVVLAVAREAAFEQDELVDREWL
jgi:hypothetical protein